MSLPGWRVIALAGCFTLAACNDNTDLVDIIEDGEVGVTSLKVNSNDLQLSVGQSFTLSTTAELDNGTQSTFNDTVRWISNNNAVATVSSDGTVTAVSAGEAAITYHWRRISGTTDVLVSEAELASIEFSTSQLEAHECSQTSLTATGIYTDGTTQALSSISEWSSSNEAVVIVQSDSANQAELLLIDSGTAEITLSSGAVSATLPVTVTDTLSELRITADALTLESGTEQLLEISGLFADNTESVVDSIANYTLSSDLNNAPTNDAAGIVLDTPPEPVTDSATSTDPESPASAEPGPTEIVLASSGTLDIVQLEDESLEIRAKVSGTATLTAACGGQTTEQLFTVIDPPELQSVTFASTDTDIEPGTTQSLPLAANYSDGTEITIFDDVQWTILSGDIDSFQLDPVSGELSANPDIVVEQSIVVQADYQSFSAQIEVFSERGVSAEVIDTQLHFIDDTGAAAPLTANESSLQVGDTVRLTLKTVYNTGEEEFSVTDLFWSNLNPDIATVDGSGLLTALAPGVSSIFAIKDNNTSTFQFTILEAEATTTTPDTP